MVMSVKLMTWHSLPLNVRSILLTIMFRLVTVSPSVVSCSPSRGGFGSVCITYVSSLLAGVALDFARKMSFSERRCSVKSVLLDLVRVVSLLLLFKFFN